MVNSIRCSDHRIEPHFSALANDVIDGNHSSPLACYVWTVGAVFAHYEISLCLLVFRSSLMDPARTVWLVVFDCPSRTPQDHVTVDGLSTCGFGSVGRD